MINLTLIKGQPNTFVSLNSLYNTGLFISREKLLNDIKPASLLTTTAKGNITTYIGIHILKAFLMAMSNQDNPNLTGDSRQERSSNISLLIAYIDKFQSVRTNIGILDNHNNSVHILQSVTNKNMSSVFRTLCVLDTDQYTLEELDWNIISHRLKDIPIGPINKPLCDNLISSFTRYANNTVKSDYVDIAAELIMIAGIRTMF